MNRFTVFFESPYWIGVFESENNDELSVCKVIFGEEPKGETLLEFVENHYFKLKFSQSYEFEGGSISISKRINPKRLQRLVAKEVNASGISTKAQEAIRLERESMKKLKKTKNTALKEQLEKMKFQKKQTKKKEKKKGH